MPKKLLSENPDTLDYVLNSLKENSEDLDTLIKEVSKIADRVSDICELSSFKRVEEKINLLQSDLKTLVESSRLAALGNKIPPIAEAPIAEVSGHKSGISETSSKSNSMVVVDCKNWSDFQEFASTAQTVYFSYQDSDKVFEIEALKDNKIAAFGGKVPMLELLLKLWFTGQLDSPAEKVLNGAMNKG
ncbi:MAG TPA: hypothetical protein VMD05_03360 [Candidatus Nanoarchaeia archaeon]|nr:hypothetical protein [Candidatus Nanoarchaeia archaeon]